MGVWVWVGVRVGAGVCVRDVRRHVVLLAERVPDAMWVFPVCVCVCVRVRECACVNVCVCE